MAFRFLTILVLCCVGSAEAADVVLTNRGDSGTNLPVTFGAIFAPGEVPAGSSLTAGDMPVQVDAKAKNKDGSLRHAVVTLVLPQAKSGKTLTVHLTPGQAAQGAPVALSALPSDFDAVISLDLGNSRLSASARDLVAHSKPQSWLSGPLVSEWWFSGPLRDANGKPDPHLTARFGIRSYGQGRPLRIEVDVENGWTYVPNPHSVAYAATITLGGKQVFSKDKLVQPSHTRWRQVFWWNTPVDVFVKPDLAQLKRARTIPNYNDQREAPPDAMLRYFKSANHGPMGTGVIYPAMPVTGQRADIGPLPAWTVSFLLSGDPRAGELTMNAADLSGSFPSHYRNEKTGRPTTSEDYPKISTHYNFVGHGPNNLPLADFAGLPKPYTAEASHEPSLAFVPYLLTGERYYLEELQFWSQWNAWTTAPEYHGFGKGLIGWDQIRGQGWSLRTLAQAAYITPDADPLKPVLLREMKANAAWYDSTYTNNPQANIFHVALRANDNAQAVAPWMDDYLTWATQYAVQLGFDEFRPFARWKGAFPVQRMINPDYCYVMAAKYYMQVMDGPHHFLDSWAKLYTANLPKEYRANGQKHECGSSEMASMFKLHNAGEMMGDATSPGGYPAQMQPALAAAVDAGVPGAAEAWAKYKARPIQPRGGIEPKWDILPWQNP